jgi:hypothetical protein
MARRPDHRAWTPEQDAIMRALFPSSHNQVLADLLGRTEPAIVGRATKLKLRKFAEYVANHSTKFKPGLVPWNTGKKGWKAGGRSAETRFKAGEMRGAAQHNYKPIGTLRISKDGHLERKVTDNHPVGARRWVAVHRLVWEAAHGPIARGYVVRFKDGQRTTNVADITLDRLECITQRENMLRNSNWTKYPVEVARLVQLKGAINRQINRMNREAAQA